MAVARSTTATLTAMIDRVRGECNDPATDRSGNTIPSAQQKWTDTDYTQAINDALREMGIWMGGSNIGDSLIYTDTTYSTDALSITLPAAVGTAYPIVKVEHLQDPNRPERITYVSPLEIEDYSQTTLTTIVPFPSFRYTVAADQLLIRPRPRSTAADIRIWYIAPPFVVSAGSDAHALTAVWPEYIMLNAALKLLRREEGGTIQQIQALAEMKQLFESFSNRQRAPQRVRRRRRGLS